MSVTNVLTSKISIIDESIELTGLSTFQLLVEIDCNEVAFALYSLKTNSYKAFKVYTYSHIEELDYIFKTDEFLCFKEYFKTIVSITNIKSTLIPSVLFEEVKQEVLLAFNHHIEKSESIEKDDFRFFEAKNLFAIDKELKAVIENNFRQPIIHHCSTSFIERILIKHKHKKEIVVSANMHQQQLELAVIKENQLLYYNSFNCQCAEDFIYYIMFMYEQLGLNPEHVDLELGGTLNINSSYYTICKKYIKQVQMQQRNNINDFSYGFEQLPSHQYQTLFDLSQCV